MTCSKITGFMDLGVTKWENSRLMASIFSVIWNKSSDNRTNMSLNERWENIPILTLELKKKSRLTTGTW